MVIQSYILEEEEFWDQKAQYCQYLTFVTRVYLPYLYHIALEIMLLPDT